MNHRDYIAGRIAREPRFELECAAAAAELELATKIAEQRRARPMDLDQLAEKTGIPKDRLEAIEEGESMTLNEALWLIHTLDMTAKFGPDFRLTAIPAQSTIRYFGRSAPILTT